MQLPLIFKQLSGRYAIHLVAYLASKACFAQDASAWPAYYGLMKISNILIQASGFHCSRARGWSFC